jgi:AP-2 complex subunit alpha
MLDYTDEADIVFKEELVLKTAILAEKFADDMQWYVDVVV